MPIQDVEILRAACCIAAMDGEICSLELKVLAKLRERAGVGQVSFDQMIKAATNDPAYYERQFRYASGEPTRTIELLFEIARVDGSVSLEEKVMIRHFAQKLGLDESAYEALEAKHAGG
jgi:tellurite resistance protein